MKERFIDLLKRIGAQSNPDSEFVKLKSAYSQPQRFYHNLAHIGNCLSDLDSAKHLAKKPDLVELAVWYHDAAYNPGAKDNEEKSAQLVYEVCLKFELPEELAGDARALILATKHNAIPERIDARILVDIDLSILGKPAQEFGEYEKNIRREYSWVSEEQFRQGRSAILQGFLDRSSIYSTDFFRSRYEARARKNLQMSLTKLRG